jgi:hypothetical protein
MKMHYKFSRPIREGKNPDGTPHYVVEITEFRGTDAMRRIKITLKDAIWLLGKTMLEPYKEM